MIGIDPHKGSHTTVALDGREKGLGQVRVRASAGQAAVLLECAAGWPKRTWAIEGARGLGQLLSQQLIGAGERVVDVPPKLAARVRLLNTGQINKNDPNDARSVAIAALRARDLAQVEAEDQTMVMRIWSRRYRDLGRLRHRGPRLLRQEDRRRDDRQVRATRAQTQDQRHALPAVARRRTPTRHRHSLPRRSARPVACSPAQRCPVR
jgi:hypothetical protein